MQEFASKNIVLGICGGIAAYKSAYLVRELIKLGAEVRVVMTASAKEFISPLTFQALTGHAVRESLWDSEAERAMSHIELARWANYFIVAPASANCLAKFAQGLADDLLSTLYLVMEVPTIICPAMNKSMWAHPATRHSCNLLEQRGAILVGPDEGSQACGEFGFGRLTDLENIKAAIQLANVPQSLVGKELLITAGPTREAIDPVRYLSNYSSGKMGYALAAAAAKAGAKVILISGPTNLMPPLGVKFYKVTTAKEMHQKVMEQLKETMIFIGCAAVADYSIEKPANSKIKKTESESLTLTLVKNPDILKEVGSGKKAVYVIGFAAETENLIANAEKKLQEKSADMIIVNKVGENQGFESEFNELTIILKDEQISLTKNTKINLSQELIAIIAARIKLHAVIPQNGFLPLQE